MYIRKKKNKNKKGEFSKEKKQRCGTFKGKQKTDTKCYKNSTEICDEWYTNEKRCGCGIKWYWDEGDTDYSNLNLINIFDKIPTRNPDKL